MDFSQHHPHHHHHHHPSHQHFFAGTQPFDFMGIQPSLPPHTAADFASASSEVFDAFPTGTPQASDFHPNPHHHQFDPSPFVTAAAGAHFGAAHAPPAPPSQSFGSPTPSDPSAAAVAAALHHAHPPPPSTQGQLRQPPPPAQGILDGGPGHHGHGHGFVDLGGIGGHHPDGDELFLAASGTASNRPASEEDDGMTPAQSKRKAQNRAAQRAFRERKERHVRELEAEVAALKAAQQQVATENERLKRDLHKVSTENEILRATRASAESSLSPDALAGPHNTGPLRFTPTEFYSSLLAKHVNKAPSHRITTSDDGERLLAAGATWEFILSHDAFKRGLVDIGHVSDMLKDCAKCDGQGPVFSESAILDAIHQSIASGSDELL